MPFVKSALGSVLTPFLISTPYWAVKLDDGRFLSERDQIRDGNRADDPRYRRGTRPFDWALDLVQGGDIDRVRELWLLCPPNQANPLGQTARLPIMEAGTAFQFKIGYFDSNIASGERSMAAQVIGRVEDRESGQCRCFIWDHLARVLIANWVTSVYAFGTWREEIASIGAISPDLHKLRLR